MAFGATYNDVNGSNSGHMWVYSDTGSSWLMVGDGIDGKTASDFWGCSVTTSGDGNTVAVGAYVHN